MLSFQAIPKVERYKVEIEDDLGRTVFQVETNATTVSVSPGILKTDKDYYWSVRTLGLKIPVLRQDAFFMMVNEKTVLTTNTDPSAAETALRYKDQWMIERKIPRYPLFSPPRGVTCGES